MVFQNSRCNYNPYTWRCPILMSGTQIIFSYISIVLSFSSNHGSLVAFVQKLYYLGLELIAKKGRSDEILTNVEIQIHHKVDFLQKT